jgi:cytoskeletal protein CcmA (bactofilin family)
MALNEFPQNRASRGHLSAAKPATADAFRTTVTAGMPLVPARGWIEERTRVAVSRNINVSGKLVFQEPVRIEGSFRGEVSSSDLVVISEEGAIDGRVKTPRLLILGELRGEAIGSKTVVLGPRSRVKGRIEADRVTVCEGARLDCDLKVGRFAERDRASGR